MVYRQELSYDDIKPLKDFLAKKELSWDEKTPEDEKAEIERARKVEGVVLRKIIKGYTRIRISPAGSWASLPPETEETGDWSSTITIL